MNLGNAGSGSGEETGEVWRDGVGDGRGKGGAAWGMGERNIAVCCWSQGVTMVMKERGDGMLE